MFGYDAERPVPALLRVAGLAIAVFGVLNSNGPLMVVGLLVGFAGIGMGWQDRRDAARTPISRAQVDAMSELSEEEFEQQLRDYRKGKRRTLPGE